MPERYEPLNEEESKSSLHELCSTCLIFCCCTAIFAGAGVLIYWIIGLVNNQPTHHPEACSVLCRGPIFKAAMEAGLYPPKNFTDFSLKFPASDILDSWDTVNKSELTNDTLKLFIETQIDTTAGIDFVSCTFSINKVPPQEFLEGIAAYELRQLATAIHKVWSSLCKRIPDNVIDRPHLHTILQLKNREVIVPGGRFREIYYWDSFWIVKGLIVSGLQVLALSLVENLLDMVDRYGYVPNGGRQYYLGRSQPPTLTLIVDEIFQDDGNIGFIRKHMPTLEQEYSFWCTERNVSVKGHQLSRYFSNQDQPRPESYLHDLSIPKSRRAHIRAAAESGWDFSSRWCENENCTSDLSNIETNNVVPVDLNVFLYKTEFALSKMFIRLNENEKAEQYRKAYIKRANAINAVFYDDSTHQWYDWDLKRAKHRKEVKASNFFPLWIAQISEHDGLLKVVAALNHSGLIQPGGVLTTLKSIQQQWDSPNAFPPIQHILVESLDMYVRDGGSTEMARKIAQNYISSIYTGHVNHGTFFEKYDAFKTGEPGGGGEYVVEKGFGWTNGVALNFLSTYGQILQPP